MPINLSASVEIAKKSIEAKVKANLKLPNHSAATGMDFLTFDASDVGTRIPLTLYIKDVYLENSKEPTTKGKLKIIIYRFNHRWLR